jgi:hypothetical protein
LDGRGTGQAGGARPHDRCEPPPCRVGVAPQ